jgi:hypothetical protein
MAFRDHFEETQRQLRIDDALKSLDRHFFDPAEPKRLISGIAVSSRNRNSKGVAFDARGVTFTLPTPLLIDHDWNRPIGRVVGLRAWGDQLSFQAEIGNDMSVCDDIWLDVTIRSLTGVSVNADGDANSDSTFARWRLAEISLVRSPADPGARIRKCWEKWPTVRLNGPSELVLWHRDESGGIVEGAIAWDMP